MNARASVAAETATGGDALPAQRLAGDRMGAPELLVLASGAAALAHQLLWTRRLVDVLGADANTFAKVIGAFFAGLALGSWWAARRPAPQALAWRRVALAEGAVALLALPLMLGGGWLETVRLHLGAAEALKLLLPLLLVLPPAVAMGLVLPAVVSARPRTPPLRLYLLNTLGGAAGLAVVVFVALPHLGLLGTALAAAAVNLLVAAVAAGCQRRALRRRAEPALSVAPPANPPPLADLLAFGSGFLVLGLEVLAQHQLAQVTINSLFSGATVLALVLLALAGSAWLVARLTPTAPETGQSGQHAPSPPSAGGEGRGEEGWRKEAWCRPGHPLSPALSPGGAGGEGGVLLTALVAAALCVAWQPLVFAFARPGLVSLPYELPPAAYYPRLVGLGLLTMAPMFLAAGTIFPLLLASRPDGARLARWLAFNGAGGWLGAEAAAGWLAPRFGLWGAVVALAGGYALLAALVLWRRRPVVPTGRDARCAPPRGPSEGWVARALADLAGRMPAALWRGGLVLMALPGIALAGWISRSLPQVRLAPGETLVEVATGREGVVATVRADTNDWRMLFNNTYTLGGSRAAANQERQALLPILLHARAESVGVLGIATGGTLAGAALAPGVARIEAAELSPLALRQARKHFRPFNRDVFTDLRVRVVQDDARWFIAGAPGRFDVIVGDLFLPWRTGEGRLFTAEHFAAVRRALKPDGLFCQWLPMFQLTRAQFDAVARTFVAEFPDAFLVRGDFYTELPILGLVGGRPLAGVRWPEVAGRCAELRSAGRSRDPLVRQVEGVAMLVVGPPPPPPHGPLITLADGWLEWDAGRNIVGLRDPWFVGVPGAEYLREVHRATLPRMPAELRAAHDAGQFWLTLEVAAKINSPVLDNLRAQMQERLPAALAGDAEADWESWPSRVKPARPSAQLSIPPDPNPKPKP